MLYLLSLVVKTTCFTQYLSYLNPKGEDSRCNIDAWARFGSSSWAIWYIGKVKIIVLKKTVIQYLYTFGLTYADQIQFLKIFGLFVNSQS